MKTIYVCPAPVGEGEPARVVRHPARSWQILPLEGDFWPDDFYTAARLRDGDVVAATPPAAPESEPDAPLAPHGAPPRGRSRATSAE